MAKLIVITEVPYVLKQDLELPESEQTSWHIRPLKFKEKAKIQDSSIVTHLGWAGAKGERKDAEMHHMTGTVAKMALEAGLVKIENLTDSNGNPVAFHQDQTPANREKVLDMIPPAWLKEIAEEILKISGMTEEEQKN